jgi:nitrile hydratase accessory protein
MTPATELRELDTTGAAAPPRRNGELVFTAPWQSRAFGMTMALCDAGGLEWEEFRQRLISAIAAWEAEHSPAGEYDYWRCWLTALELSVDLGGAEIDARARWIEANGNDAGHHGHPQ